MMTSCLLSPFYILHLFRQFVSYTIFTLHFFYFSVACSRALIHNHTRTNTRTNTGNLNEYISHYETLNYDHQQIHASHSRAKRSVTKDPYVYLKFRAHNRPFHIRLKRDVVTFSDKLVVSGKTPSSSIFFPMTFYFRLNRYYRHRANRFLHEYCVR